jgi:hypothetical protein
MSWSVLSMIELFSGAAMQSFRILILATGTATLLTLAFQMITLRYKFDLWAALAVLSLSGL